MFLCDHPSIHTSIHPFIYHRLEGIPEPTLRETDEKEGKTSIAHANALSAKRSLVDREGSVDMAGDLLPGGGGKGRLSSKLVGCPQVSD